MKKDTMTDLSVIVSSVPCAVPGISCHLILICRMDDFMNGNICENCMNELRHIIFFNVGHFGRVFGWHRDAMACFKTLL